MPLAVYGQVFCVRDSLIVFFIVLEVILLIIDQLVRLFRAFNLSLYAILAYGKLYFDCLDLCQALEEHMNKRYSNPKHYQHSYNTCIEITVYRRKRFI